MNEERKPSGDELIREATDPATGSTGGLTGAGLGGPAGEVLGVGLGTTVGADVAGSITGTGPHETEPSTEAGIKGEAAPSAAGGGVGEIGGPPAMPAQVASAQKGEDPDVTG